MIFSNGRTVKLCCSAEVWSAPGSVTHDYRCTCITYADSSALSPLCHYHGRRARIEVDADSIRIFTYSAASRAPSVPALKGDGLFLCRLPQLFRTSFASLILPSVCCIQSHDIPLLLQFRQAKLLLFQFALLCNRVQALVVCIMKDRFCFYTAFVGSNLTGYQWIMP